MSGENKSQARNSFKSHHGYLNFRFSEKTIFLETMYVYRLNDLSMKIKI